MLKKTLTLGLAGLLNFSPICADKLDDFVSKSYIDENGSEWRDHFWSSLFLTLNDSFLLKHAGYKKDPEDLAAKVRFLETFGYQGHTMLYERKVTPVYAAFDIVGTHLGHELFPKMNSFQPFVDKVADITDKDKLKNLIFFTVGTVAVGYTLPSRRDIFELDLDEQIDGNNFSKHVSFFSYYTFRTSWLLEYAGYNKHPPESLAWRVGFGLGLAKELIVDSLIGKGPSIRDAAEDGLGVAIGYGAWKAKNKISLLPYNKGIKLMVEF